MNLLIPYYNGGFIIREFKFEYKGKQAAGKVDPLVDSQYLYISVKPALEISKLQKLDDLIKLEIVNLKHPFNKYTNFCLSKTTGDKTYFSFKIDFPTLLFMKVDEKDKIMIEIVFLLKDHLKKLIENLEFYIFF